MSTTAWNDSSGDWQGLSDPSQEVRYQTLASLVDHFKRRGTVLDIGCGEGLLASYLDWRHWYEGVEPSKLAAQSAKVFITEATAENYKIRQHWDVIVFNEMLYYCMDPVFVLDRYMKFLKPGGIFIISIYQKPGTFLKSRIKSALGIKHPLANMHCTKVVKDFLLKEMTILLQSTIYSGSNPSMSWCMWVARPKKNPS